jgi:hypothetical protein
LSIALIIILSLAPRLNCGCFFAAYRKCLDFLFQAASSAVLSWCKEQGFLPGICAVGHTFGGVLNFHPHIHVLLSDGGLADDPNFDFLVWKDCSFFPEKVLKARFKYLLIKSLRYWIKEKVKEKAFSIPSSVLNLWHKKYRVRDFFSLSQHLYKVIWYVYIGEKLTNASFTTRYIGRYAERPAISETKIIYYSFEKQIVRFRHKDKISATEKVDTVSIDEFIKRLISHIPEKHFRMIRYYGFYANRVKNSLLELICYQLQILFGSAQVLYSPDEQPRTWRQRILLTTGSDPLLCPNCQLEMELIEIAFRSRDGPLKLISFVK